MADQIEGLSLHAAGLAAGYDSAFQVRDIDLLVEPGTVTTLIGPNGSGKSTLLRALSRILKPKQGVVLLDGKDINRMPSREVAQKLALLPQSAEVPDSTVEEIVWRGRYPHLGWLARQDRHDFDAVRWAMAATNVLHLRRRPLKELSGGELRRVWTALALAQEPQVLLLDEPTAFLDIAHQLEVLELVRQLNEGGMTIVMAMQDLAQTCRHSHRVVVLKDGRIVGQGRPDEVLVPAVIREVFGVEVEMIPDPVLGCPVPIPYARVRDGADADVAEPSCPASP